MTILKRTLIALWVIVLGLVPTARVFADNEFERKVELQDEISFCKSKGCKSNSNSKGMGSADAGGNNTNYAGEQVWSEGELEAIRANQAIYEEAADQFGFPWPVMAVLHSHETGLVRYNPDNGQGVYQLYSYTDGGTNGNSFYPAGPISEDEFRRQTLIAAEVVSGMVGDLNDPGNVKRLFFQYNGVADVYIQKALNMGFSQEEAENGEGSAYVMNRYDARRDPTTSEMDPAWPGRYVTDGVYDSTATTDGFGAYVQFEALAGSSGECHGNNGGIAETAIEISWEGRNSHAMDDPKPEYVEAMKATGVWGSLGGWPPEGASCDRFVATVMRYSGADPEFPLGAVCAQYSYLQSHPEMYAQIEGDDYANLEPGDIMIADCEHIYLYVGEIDGEMYQASASYGDRTGEHFPGVYFSDDYEGGRHYDVFRRINQ